MFKITNYIVTRVYFLYFSYDIKLFFIIKYTYLFDNRLYSALHFAKSFRHFKKISLIRRQRSTIKDRNIVISRYLCIYYKYIPIKQVIDIYMSCKN